MASQKEFVDYVVEQLQEAGVITSRKMFGEYGLYCNGRIFAVICEDQLFVKITEAGQRLWPELPAAPPYEGGPPYFLVENVDDRAFLTRLAVETCQALPPVKPKTSKGGRKNRGKAGL